MFTSKKNIFQSIIKKAANSMDNISEQISQTHEEIKKNIKEKEKEEELKREYSLKLYKRAINDFMLSIEKRLMSQKDYVSLLENGDEKYILNFLKRMFDSEKIIMDVGKVLTDKKLPKTLLSFSWSIKTDVPVQEGYRLVQDDKICDFVANILFDSLKERIDIPDTKYGIRAKLTCSRKTNIEVRFQLDEVTLKEVKNEEALIKSKPIVNSFKQELINKITSAEEIPNYNVIRNFFNEFFSSDYNIIREFGQILINRELPPSMFGSLWSVKGSIPLKAECDLWTNNVSCEYVANLIYDVLKDKIRLPDTEYGIRPKLIYKFYEGKLSVSFELNEITSKEFNNAKLVAFRRPIVDEFKKKLLQDYNQKAKVDNNKISDEAFEPSVTSLFINAWLNDEDVILKLGHVLSVRHLEFQFGGSWYVNGKVPLRISNQLSSNKELRKSISDLIFRNFKEVVNLPKTKFGIGNSLSCENGSATFYISKIHPKYQPPQNFIYIDC